MGGPPASSKIAAIVSAAARAGHLRAEQPLAERSLGVGIDQEHPEPFPGQRPREVMAGGGLAHAPFLFRNATVCMSKALVNSGYSYPHNRRDCPFRSAGAWARIAATRAHTIGPIVLSRISTRVAATHEASASSRYSRAVRDRISAMGRGAVRERTGQGAGLWGGKAGPRSRGAAASQSGAAIDRSRTSIGRTRLRQPCSATQVTGPVVPVHRLRTRRQGTAGPR